MLDRIAALLIALALFATPLASLLQGPCDCCNHTAATMPAQSETAAVTPSCCGGGAAAADAPSCPTTPADSPDSPDQRPGDAGCDCPRPCCCGGIHIPLAFQAKLRLAHAPPAPAAIVDRTRELISDPHLSRLKRPPRALAHA